MSDTLDLFGRLFIPFDDDKKKTKRIKGQEITFVEWVQYIIRAHKDFTGGFSTEVRDITEIASGDGAHIIMTVRVTDIASGMYHESTGMAPATKDKATWGGAAAEAESQALRRAFAHFGLGLEMYLDDDEFLAVREGLGGRQEPVGSVTSITDTQKDRLNQYKEALLGHAAHGRMEAPTVTAMFERARDRLKAASDRKNVAGIIIRELKEWAEGKGLDLDPSGEA